MNDEYISKQKIIDYLNGYLHSLGEGGADDLLFDRGQRRALINAIQDISAVKAADVQPANQWISVKDRLPNHYEEVLAVSKLENIVYFAWYDADISMFMGHSHMWTTKEVTHWMPLPEPPKDGDTECQ